MASLNTNSVKSPIFTPDRLAGGYGPRGAMQPDEMQLRRLVMACLLWENIAYSDGQSVASEIKKLCHKLPADVVARIAVEARFEQKLRHVPLLLCRELARHSDKSLTAETLAKVIHRPDELSEFLAIYWKDNTGPSGAKKKTLSHQVKKGLAAAMGKFNQYQLSKYDRSGKEIRLRDVMFLTHPKPTHQEQTSIWKQLADDALPPADTWEVGLSAAKTEDEKRQVWERLLEEGKLPAFAMLKNMRNMVTSKVSKHLIAQGLNNCKSSMLLPVDFMKAVKYAPDWTRELENLMFRCAGEFPKLRGWTVFVVDVSGSMRAALSSKSEFSRLDAAASMAVLAAEMCEHVTIYATAGSDSLRKHQTKKLKPLRGFSLAESIVKSAGMLGGGGIFTRQVMDYVREHESETPDRVVVFSDSQDCDFPTSGKPKPCGKHNYIVDVSSHKNGVNYKGVWTAEISGFSENFLRYISALESSNMN